MQFIVVSLHVFVCFALIMIVLLQTGKGADMGASLGGAGNQTLFGTSGASTFLSKMTTVIAVLFMVTSLYLAYQSGHTQSSSVMESAVEQPKTAVPEESAPTQAEPIKEAAPAAEPAAEQAAKAETETSQTTSE